MKSSLFSFTVPAVARGSSGFQGTPARGTCLQQLFCSRERGGLQLPQPQRLCHIPRVELGITRLLQTSDVTKYPLAEAQALGAGARGPLGKLL